MTTTTKRAPPRTFLRKVGHFVMHYLEMCMACCVGGATLGIASFGGAALLGYPDLVPKAPVFSTLMLAVILTVPMVAWMRFRHHGWRPSLEMGPATMELGILLIALGAIGVVPVGDMFEWVNPSGVPGHARPHAFAPRPLHREHGPSGARRLRARSAQVAKTNR
jgi:hypothetical protein